MNVANDIIKLISRLPPEGLQALSKLITALLNSKDPLDAVTRAAKAAAAKRAYKAAARR